MFNTIQERILSNAYIAPQLCVRVCDRIVEVLVVRGKVGRAGTAASGFQSPRDGTFLNFFRPHRTTRNKIVISQKKKFEGYYLL